MKFLSSLDPTSLREKTCLLRVDINSDEDDIGKSLRVMRVARTVSFLSQQCRRVIILAHRGRPDMKEKVREKFSLAPYVDDLSSAWNVPLSFIPYTSVREAESALGKETEKVVLLENIRLFDGEYRNCKRLSESLASLADIYVNDAFSNSHRKHASMVGVASFLPSYAGWGIEEELSHIDSLKAQSDNTVFVLGGAKILEKVALLKQFLPSVSAVLLGGGPANTALKEKGVDVKNSLVESIDVSELLASEKVFIPTDVVWDKDLIVDIGKETEKEYREILSRHKKILWNGPLGFTEKGYRSGTDMVIDSINTYSMGGIIGGGETLSSIGGRITSPSIFLSTGGGALLKYLSSGSLVALDVLS